MKILIDDRPVEESEVTGDSLEAMLQNIIELHLPEGHLAQKVLVNGEHYVEEVPHDAAQVPRAGIETLKVITLSREDIASEFMDHGPEILGTILEAAPRVAELFRVADEAEANEHYLAFLESLQNFLKMVSLATDALGIGPETPFVDGRTLAQESEELNRIVQEMLGVQEDQDWVLLADLVEYDLYEALVRWQDGLPNLAS
jgi:hypothetical protein